MGYSFDSRVRYSETGEFDVSGIGNAHWVSIAVVAAIAVAAAVVGLAMRSRKKKKG